MTDYANTIVFLAQHTRDPLVITELMALTKRLFADEQPLSFEGDMAALNSTVSMVPKLIYRPTDPNEHRRKALEYRDKLGEAKDPLDETMPDDSFDDLNLGARLNLAVKSAEILGQIIKRNYGALKKETKISVLNEIYDAPLRGAKCVLSMLVEDPKELISLIDHWLQVEKPHATEEQRQELAQRWFFATVAAFAVGSIKKIAEAAGSEYLREEYVELLKRNSVLGYRLIDLAIKLEAPKSLPFVEIAKLASDAKSNAIVFRLLQTLVLNHLHMFRTNDRDKQKLCESVDLLVATQRGIDVAAHATKLITDRR